MKHRLISFLVKGTLTPLRFNGIFTSHFRKIYYLFISLFLIVSSVAFGQSTTYQAGAGHSHQVGQGMGLSWQASVLDPPGFLSHGPYTSSHRDGEFRVDFELSIDTLNVEIDDVLIELDVYDSALGETLSRRIVRRKDFNQDGVAQKFSISFFTQGANNLEFRVFHFAKALVTHSKTEVLRLSDSNKVFKFDAVGGQYRHKIGLSDGEFWEANVSHGTGFMSYGPYTQNLGVGSFVAHFELKIDNHNADNRDVATIDIYSSSNRAQLGRQVIRRSDFKASNQLQTFSVPFQSSGESLEFRIFSHGKAQIFHRRTNISSNDNRVVFQGASPAHGHSVGFASDSSWMASFSDGSGFLTYGPYTKLVAPGNANVEFDLSIDNNSADNALVATLQVYDASRNVILGRRLVRRNDFSTIRTPQKFVIHFEKENLDPSVVEFRIFVHGKAELKHHKTVLQNEKVGMDALWNRKAHFEKVEREVIGQEVSNPSSIVVKDKTLYRFSRVHLPTFGGCPQRIKMVVQSSENKGKSWTDPTDIALPVHPYDDCSVVDGSAFYDDETDIWHLLAQCFSLSANEWQLCHYVRASNPMGLFSSSGDQPSVASGELWGKICAGSGKHCRSDMIDEGTPQIVYKKNGFYYVSFHGAVYLPNDRVTGARGMARTTNFVDWQVTGGDLSATPDAILSETDCTQWNFDWNGGCIGYGAGTMIKSNRKYHLLAESSDLSLICTPLQNWFFGLHRSKTISRSGTWEVFDGNPFVSNNFKSPIGCDNQYANLYRLNGEIFLSITVYSPIFGFYSIETFHLVRGSSSSVNLVTGPSSI